MILIDPSPADHPWPWDAADRSFTVHHEMVLQLVDGQLAYTLRPVAPYEKTYLDDDAADADAGNSFIARVQAQPAGEIRLSRHWNRYAYIDDLVVARGFRRQGVATALVRHAIGWAQAKGLPGVMLETQANNVAACRLYEACGFRLAGFDMDLYKALGSASGEIALFWYWHP